MKLGFFTLTTLAASLALLLTDAPQASALSLDMAAHETSLAQTSFEVDEMLAQTDSEVLASTPNPNIGELYQDIKTIVQLGRRGMDRYPQTSNDPRTAENLFKYQAMPYRTEHTYRERGSDGKDRILTIPYTGWILDFHGRIISIAESDLKWTLDYLKAETIPMNGGTFHIFEAICGKGEDKVRPAILKKLEDYKRQRIIQDFWAFDDGTFFVKWRPYSESLADSGRTIPGMAPEAPSGRKKNGKPK